MKLVHPFSPNMKPTLKLYLGYLAMFVLSLAVGTAFGLAA